MGSEANIDFVSWDSSHAWTPTTPTQFQMSENSEVVYFRFIDSYIVVKIPGYFRIPVTALICYCLYGLFHYIKSWSIIQCRHSDRFPIAIEFFIQVWIHQCKVYSMSRLLPCLFVISELYPWLNLTYLLTNWGYLEKIRQLCCVEVTPHQ